MDYLVMKKTKTQLQREIDILSHDPIWGCYTRAALELRWDEFRKHAVAVVYADIDDMHSLNSKYGHSGTDKRIASVIENVRHGERGRDIVASRYLNGDELVFILKSGNGQSFCERIQSDFLAVGIHLTMAHSPKVTDSPFDTINPLDEQVNQYKRLDLRGEIISLYK